jgi:hypothetical protein
MRLRRGARGGKSRKRRRISDWLAEAPCAGVTAGGRTDDIFVEEALQRQLRSGARDDQAIGLTKWTVSRLRLSGAAAGAERTAGREPRDW